MYIFGGVIDLSNIEPNDTTNLIQPDVEIRPEAALLVALEISFDTRVYIEAVLPLAENNGKAAP
jgi:hypothetical protein